MKRHLNTALMACLASLAGPLLAQESRPLWEFGLGVAAVDFADYRGSDQRQTYLLPAPYFVYHGKVLRADRKGMRGVFLESERFELNLSLSGSVPVDSDGNRARRDMPDLRPTIEFGPSLDLRLWHDPERHAQLDLRLPVRWSIRLGGRPRDNGLVFSPRLNLDLRDPFGQRGWNLGLLAGPIFTDRRNNAYYYDVAPEFATDQRPAYASAGGYAGSQAAMALSKRYARHWVGFFMRYDNLEGAAFDDSPLVRTHASWAAGLAVSWIIGESSQRVELDD